MKTQISRVSYRPKKRYSGVYQQQGRMITDADWNELAELVKRRLDEALTDVVASGAPRERGVEVEKAGPAQPLSIRKGHVYVDGVVAEVVGADPKADTFGFDQQADFPSPPALPANDYRVYADVWERTVISLEDPDLRDAALHGADTATRTQTMAQVKWCGGAVDPEDPAQNPQRGDASLNLTLRKKKEEKDPCDPCADEVGVAARTGNYLFRLEVHDVQGSFSAPSQLTLKWSSENGAEQHAVPTPPAELPPEFSSGDWIFEFYSPTSEKHLGVHLAPGFSPTRGQLETSLPTPLPSLPHVRRWDGYCILKRTGNTWSLVEGRDRGVELSEVSAADADGHVDLGNSFAVKLEALTLTLALKNRTFVAGDYWLAPVREAIHTTGDTVLAAAPPLGVIHHYLRLARVDGAGKLEPYPTDELRRLNFPPLTDIRAGDVGYDPDCPSNLFDPNVHDTVEKALNQVCQIAAQHIAYQTNCPSGLFDASHDTVKKALDRVCEIAAEHVAFAKPCNTSIYKGVAPASLKTVADALKLLCDIKAGHVSYEADPACTDLAEAKTVQEALDKLCLRPSGGGCRVTVGKGGEFETLQEAIEKLLAENHTDLCICLLPGDHELPDGLSVSQEGIHLAIAGCGPGTRLRVKSGTLGFVDLAALALSDLVIERELDSKGLIILGCQQVELTGIDLQGLDRGLPLLQVAKARRIHLAGNLFEVWVAGSLDLPRAILGPDLEALFADFDRARFFREVLKVSTDVATFSAAKRRTLAAEIGERVKNAGDQLTGPEFRAYSEFRQALLVQIVDADHIADLLRAIRFRTLAGRRPPAVSLRDAAADTTVEDCEFVGQLQLYGERPGPDLTQSELESLFSLVGQGQARIETMGSALQIRGNLLTSLTVGEEMLLRLRAIIEQQGGVLGGIFGTGHLSDNALIAAGNQIVSGFLNLNANVFHLVEPVGWAVARSTAYVGNQAEDANLVNISAVSEKAANTLGISP